MEIPTDLPSSDSRRGAAVPVPPLKPTAPIFLRADADNKVIHVSQSLAAYLGVEKRSLLASAHVADHPKCTTSDHFKVHHFWTEKQPPV